MSTSRTITSTGFDRTSTRLDIYAASLSALCVFHCLALPLLVPFLAFAAPFAENEAVHRGLVRLLAAPISLWVIFRPHSLSKHLVFVGAASLGLGLLVAGAFVKPLEAHEQPITLAGALLLGTAHLWRWLTIRRLSRQWPEIGPDCPE